MSLTLYLPESGPRRQTVECPDCSPRRHELNVSERTAGPNASSRIAAHFCDRVGLECALGKHPLQEGAPGE